MLDPLEKYSDLFGRLHRNQNPTYGAAPHKPILLLSVLEEIRRGGISTNFIPLNVELIALFRFYWRFLVPENTWREKIANPFRFMVQEGFWELVKDNVPVSAQPLGYNPSLKQLTTEVDGARLVEDLWRLLQIPMANQELQTLLLKEYFGRNLPNVAAHLPHSPIDYEIEKLKAEARSKFRIRRVAETTDETGYYVRHALFPKVVKTLYNDACAVCKINVRLDDRSGLVDAAHIMPFGLFHNDDPRNGIAFCKNHHRGFDEGWFSLADDYRILISPRLQNASTYVTLGAPIALPSDSTLAPAVSALEWHRNNRYQK